MFAGCCVLFAACNVCNALFVAMCCLLFVARWELFVVSV